MDVEYICSVREKVEQLIRQPVKFTFETNFFSSTGCYVSHVMVGSYGGWVGGMKQSKDDSVISAVAYLNADLDTNVYSESGFRFRNGLMVAPRIEEINNIRDNFKTVKQQIRERFSEDPQSKNIYTARLAKIYPIIDELERILRESKLFCYHLLSTKIIKNYIVHSFYYFSPYLSIF